MGEGALSVSFFCLKLSSECFSFTTLTNNNFLDENRLFTKRDEEPRCQLMYVMIFCDTYKNIQILCKLDTFWRTSVCLIVYKSFECTHVICFQNLLTLMGYPSPSWPPTTKTKVYGYFSELRVLGYFLNHDSQWRILFSPSKDKIVSL